MFIRWARRWRECQRDIAGRLSTAYIENSEGWQHTKKQAARLFDYYTFYVIFTTITISTIFSHATAGRLRWP